MDDTVQTGRTNVIEEDPWEDMSDGPKRIRVMAWGGSHVMIQGRTRVIGEDLMEREESMGLNINLLINH